MMMNTITYRSIHTGRSDLKNSVHALDTANSRLNRLLLKLFAACVVFMFLFSYMLIVHSSASESGPLPVQTGERLITVSTGDTLWSIAKRVQHPGADVRKTVYLIQKRNGLESSYLQAGQTLIVPIQSAE
ncbi:LysM peptidoglycan-binding domain-containing protein [Paenibacillus tarimensis]